MESLISWFWRLALLFLKHSPQRLSRALWLCVCWRSSSLADDTHQMEQTPLDGNWAQWVPLWPPNVLRLCWSFRFTADTLLTTSINDCKTRCFIVCLGGLQCWALYEETLTVKEPLWVLRAKMLDLEVLWGMFSYLISGGFQQQRQVFYCPFYSLWSRATSSYSY